MTAFRHSSDKPSKNNIVKVNNYRYLMGKTAKILSLLIFILILNVPSRANIENNIRDRYTIDDPENLKIAVYPNPSKGDLLRIDVIQHDSDVAEIKLYSALGNVIFSEIYFLSRQNQTLTLNMADKLKSGVYMLSIKTSNAQVTRRVLVRN
jgi:hypothetical protein